jgi:hypothetical protein
VQHVAPPGLRMRARQLRRWQLASRPCVCTCSRVLTMLQGAGGCRRLSCRTQHHQAGELLPQGLLPT